MNLIARTAGAALAAGLTLVYSSTAWSAGTSSQAQQNYRQERAHCMSGKSQQDKATCLKEAQGAYQESRRGGLKTQGDAQLTNNTTDRCGAQPEAGRAACLERVTGAGSSEGSVKGGGILRQTETRVP
jgi:hypothetical protein